MTWPMSFMKWEQDRQAIEGMLGRRVLMKTKKMRGTKQPIPRTVSELIDYAVGCCFGRWDIRCATGEKPEPPNLILLIPSCLLPGCCRTTRIAAEENDMLKLPMRISWPGILVDDPGHTEDIMNRVREALEIIWTDRSDAIEQEACEILGGLRDYLKRPTAFFKVTTNVTARADVKLNILVDFNQIRQLYTLVILSPSHRPDIVFSCTRFR